MGVGLACGGTAAGPAEKKGVAANQHTRRTPASGTGIRILPYSLQAFTQFRPRRTATLVSKAKTMIDLFDTAQELQEFFFARKWRFCFIGGLALQRWGEPRVTQDVDCTLFTGFGDEETFTSELTKQYASRIENAEEFALAHRVLLLQSKAGIGIDIALGGLPYEMDVVTRASDFEFLPSVVLRTCSAEDLIILKAFADRTRDWADIEGILLRHGSDLRWKLVYSELQPLCELKESPRILERLKELQSELR